MRRRLESQAFVHASKNGVALMTDDATTPSNFDVTVCALVFGQAISNIWSLETHVRTPLSNMSGNPLGTILERPCPEAGELVENAVLLRPCVSSPAKDRITAQHPTCLGLPLPRGMGSLTTTQASPMAVSRDPKQKCNHYTFRSFVDYATRRFCLLSLLMHVHTM